MNSNFFIALGMIVCGVLAIDSYDKRKPPKPYEFSDETIAKVHTCHDKQLEAAITRDHLGEHVTCVKNWEERKKDMKRGKYI